VSGSDASVSGGDDASAVEATLPHAVHTQRKAFITDNTVDRIRAR
jgi:hypothetical protein